jgi:hypothetical protein
MLGSRPEPYDGPIWESVSLPPPGTALPFPGPVAGLSPKTAPLKQIPVVDPPMPATGRLPWLLGKVHALPHPRPKTEWYDTCALDEPQFIEILELARVTDGASCTCEQCVALTHVCKEIRATAHGGPAFAIEGSTPPDLRLWMEKWVNNPTGIPLTIREESDHTLNLSDMNVWAWVSLTTPLKVGREFRRRLWNLFKVPGHWELLLGNCVRSIPSGDTLRASVTCCYQWVKTLETELDLSIARWLAGRGVRIHWSLFSH